MIYVFYFSAITLFCIFAEKCATRSRKSNYSALGEGV